MEKDIPFYPSRKDNTSCMLACFRSALEYLTGCKYGWKQLEELTGYKPGKAAWTVKAWTELAQQGFDIRMIEGFDYDRYLDEGEAYLSTFLKPKEVEWQLKNSNLTEIRPLIPKFQEYVHHEKKSPGPADIDDMLENGYLILTGLDLKTLNNQEGYEAHMILIHDKEGSQYVAHDPGPPPEANRRIRSELLLKAMGGKDNTVEVTGIRLKDVQKADS